MKERSATAALVLALLAWSLVPALPRLIKVSLAFPSLQDATYIEGRFEYSGEWPRDRQPRYYVINDTGRHEFFCGYAGGRHTCLTRPSDFAGQPIQVWTTWTFGTMQMFVHAKPGIKPHPLDGGGFSYAVPKAANLNPEYPPVMVRWGVVAILVFVLPWLIWSEPWSRRSTARKDDAARAADEARD